jgi:putative hydrolase of the HAD superfamily
VAISGHDFGHITTVIFDLDGTLIEHTWQLSRICEALFTQFAGELAPVSQTEFFEVYWSKSEDMWYMMVDGVLDGNTAARYGYVNTLRTLGQDVGLAETMLEYWIELVLEEAIPFEDTFVVLDIVRRQYATGILTNGFINLQRRKIEKYNLAAYVDFTLVSEEAGFHKPDKLAFLAALRLANNAIPEKTVYVGDNLAADIDGALGAGITPVFFNARDDQESPRGIVKIKKLSELLGLLEL